MITLNICNILSLPQYLLDTANLTLDTSRLLIDMSDIHMSWLAHTSNLWPTWFPKYFSMTFHIHHLKAPKETKNERPIKI